MTEKTKHESHIPEEAREHYQKAREELHKSIETLLPAGFIEHRRAARKEMLLAMRSMLDSAINHMDKKA
jgi:hypothetical protein